MISASEQILLILPIDSLRICMRGMKLQRCCVKTMAIQKWLEHALKLWGVCLRCHFFLGILILWPRARQYESLKGVLL